MKYDLETLLEGIDETNLHEEMLSGDPVGNEVVAMRHRKGSL